MVIPATGQEWLFLCRDHFLLKQYLFILLKEIFMPILNYKDTPHVKLLPGIHGAFHHSDQLTFGHITLEEGAVLPEHQHIHEQWTHVIEGQFEFNLDGQITILTPGISALIPSNTRHGGKALTRCRMIDCFMPVREEYKNLELWSEA